MAKGHPPLLMDKILKMPTRDAHRVAKRPSRWCWDDQRWGALVSPMGVPGGWLQVPFSLRSGLWASWPLTSADADRRVCVSASNSLVLKKYKEYKQKQTNLPSSPIYYRANKRSYQCMFIQAPVLLVLQSKKSDSQNKWKLKFDLMDFVTDGYVQISWQDSNTGSLIRIYKYTLINIFLK